LRHPDLTAPGELLPWLNDGQKGMGLIMLILIGTVPTLCVNRANAKPDGAIQRLQSAASDRAKAAGYKCWASARL